MINEVNPFLYSFNGENVDHKSVNLKDFSEEGKRARNIARVVQKLIPSTETKTVYHAGLAPSTYDLYEIALDDDKIKITKSECAEPNRHYFAVITENKTLAIIFAAGTTQYARKIVDVKIIGDQQTIVNLAKTIMEAAKNKIDQTSELSVLQNELGKNAFELNDL